jgi:hypothetical protein
MGIAAAIGSLVVYNLTRFAREKYDHFALRAHLKSLGISLRSATEPIDDTSTGKLHAEAVEEIDVKGILAFAERVLPRAADLWVQASLDQKQRLRQLFFPDGIAFDGNRFNRTGATALFFKYLAPEESAEENVVTRIFASWNQMSSWLRQVERLRHAA